MQDPPAVSPGSDGASMSDVQYFAGWVDSPDVEASTGDNIERAERRSSGARQPERARTHAAKPSMDVPRRRRCSFRPTRRAWVRPYRGGLAVMVAVNRGQVVQVAVIRVSGR
jgi:hypothetical protein